MDLITQAFLGAAVGELILGKRLGKSALAWGALIGVLPELDAVLFTFFDTARQSSLHRGPFHSLLGIALGSYALARGLALLWRWEKISQLEAGGFAFAIWSTHVLVDCFSVDGAALLWPVSGSRISFNHLFETDPLFTLPLVVTVTWMALLREKKAKKPRGKAPAPRSERRRLCRWGLGLCAAYALLSIGMKFVASAGFEADLLRRGVKFDRRMETPTPYNIVLWRAVVDRGDEFWIGYRSVFEFHQTPVRWTIYPKGSASLTLLADMRETKTLTTLTDGWWLARPHSKGAWLGDLRHGESRIWGGKKGMVDSRLAKSWVIDAGAKKERLRVITEQSASGETLARMRSRIFGKRENWEASPRLAGIAGSLPEFLAVEE